MLGMIAEGARRRVLWIVALLLVLGTVLGLYTAAAQDIARARDLSAWLA